MIKVINSLWQNLQRPKIYVDVAIDHIELAEDYLMLGVDLDWNNQTADTLTVREVKIRLFHKGRLEDPIKFYAQGHFVRVPGQKVIKKTVGIKSFDVPAAGSHVEGIRFFTRTILNLDDGIYPVDIHTIVSGGTYVHQADIQITSRIKYWTSEPWIPAESLT